METIWAQSPPLLPSLHLEKYVSQYTVHASELTVRNFDSEHHKIHSTSRIMED